MRRVRAFRLRPTDEKPLALATDGRVVATLESAPEGAAVVLRDRRGAVRLAGTGDPSPVGGTLSFNPEDRGIMLTRRRIVMLAGLDGATAQAAVLEAPVRRAR